jgi:HAD superfamily hydrolase (TIGR01549 family)
MSEIKIVSFDVEGTLVTFDFTGAIWYEGIPESYAKKYCISFEKALQTVKSEYDKVSDQRMEWYDINYWTQKFDIGISSEVMSRYVDRIKFYPEVLDVLASLDKRYQLVAASGTPREFLAYLLADVNSHFTKVFSSTSDYKSVKNKEFFGTVCREMKVSPGQIVHVGDNKQFDFDSASAAGIKSYFLDRSAKRQDSTITSLSQLKELLIG